MATSLKLDDELKHRVKRLAGAKRRSPHWIMMEAVKEYVDREEARLSFLREAEESWADFQATGRHLTGEEVRASLRTWGTDDEKALPECHE